MKVRKLKKRKVIVDGMEVEELEPVNIEEELEVLLI